MASHNLAVAGKISRNTVKLPGPDIYGGTLCPHDSTSSRVIIVHTQKILQNRTAWLRGGRLTTFQERSSSKGS